MGGCGSGNGLRHGTRRTVESCSFIDVRTLARRGMLAHDGFQLRWNDGPVQIVWVIVEPGALTLTYECRAEGHMDTLNYKVRLSTTPCHYGGTRYWFRCPARGCARRVAILYLGGRYFACRNCHRLAYRMQNKNPFDRGLLKAQRIRMRLGGSANMTLPFPPKPRFMRWNTYYRLAEADRQGEMRWITGLQAWLDSQKRAA